jgi:NhaP-type Na+/H+ or K+/H+ antiporter
VTAVGAAGGAYWLGEGLGALIGIATFVIVGVTLKRSWLDKERRAFTDILIEAQR